MAQTYELPETLILDYNTWRSGSIGLYETGLGPTNLFNSEGYMCCLGQFSCQARVPKDKLISLSTPKGLKMRNVVVDAFIDDVGFETRLALDAILINDDTQKPVANRAVELKNLFKENGYTIKLVNFPKCIMEEIAELENTEE